MSSKDYFMSRANKSKKTLQNEQNNNKKVENNLFHDRLDTYNSDDYSNCSQNYSKSQSWNSEDNDEVYLDEMNIDVDNYNIDETGLDTMDKDPSGSDESESNGKIFKI
jgi:hypothetical protein